MIALFRRWIEQKWAEWQTKVFIRREIGSWLGFSCNRLELLARAVDRAPTRGLVCEFGVGGGATINHLAYLLGPHRTIYGFDSFQGLPEDWRPGFPRGRYAQDAPPSVPTNVRLVRGLFAETLPGFVHEHLEDVALLHIDCDLYSSTRTVLDALRLNIGVGSVIVFDEFFGYPGWRSGEYRAFMEFVTNEHLSFRYLGYVRGGEQVAVQITEDRR